MGEQRSIVHVFLVISELAVIPLCMVSISYVQAQLDKLRRDARYTRKLTMKKAKVVKKSGDDGALGEPQEKKLKTEQENLVVSMVHEEDRILEKKPKERKYLFKGDKHIARVYGLSGLFKFPDCRSIWN